MSISALSTATSAHIPHKDALPPLDLARINAITSRIMEEAPLQKMADSVIELEKEAKNARNDGLPKTPLSDKNKRHLLYTQEDKVIPTEQEIDDSSKASAKKDFMEYMSLTPEERFRAQILKDMNLTEEDLAALPAEVREEIEEEITTLIKEKMENKIDGRV